MANTTRSIWSGAISFGIVNIPVRLVTAVREKHLHFHQISEKKHVRVRQKLVAEGTDAEVARDDIVKGYEIAPEQYVTVTEQELQGLAAEKSRSIDIVDFVQLAEIDPIFYDTPYWVVPDERAGRAYWLLCEAMKESGRVAIARFVMRNKEMLAAIRPVEHGRGGAGAQRPAEESRQAGRAQNDSPGAIGLLLETMHYHDEVVPMDEIAGHAKPVKPAERELTVARQIIDSLTTEYRAERYEDEYRKRVLGYLEKKAEGHTETIAEEPVRKQGKVLDLMAALEESLGQVRAGRGGERAQGGRPSTGEPARRAARPHPRPAGHRGKRAS
jgi:DNA end-binding protein Ku